MSDQTGDGRARLKVDAGTQRIARVYAEALYTQAQKANAVEAVLEELRHLVQDVIATNPSIHTFFSGATVGREKRAEVLQGALGGRVSDLVFRFLLVLNHHDRLDILGPVVEVFQDLFEERTGKLRVSVATAVPLPDDQRDRLVQQLTRVTGKQLILESRIDPELLGGLVVQIGDFRYDGSVLHQLTYIRTQLIESSSHEIQAGRDRFSLD